MNKIMRSAKVLFLRPRVPSLSSSFAATYDQLVQPENAPMRAAFIGAGGLLGYMMGAIRGRYVTISSHCTNRGRDIAKDEKRTKYQLYV